MPRTSPRRRRGRPTSSTSSSSARPGRGVSPLGDPVPFSAYLIGRLVNPTEYETQFNLDADRAYAYLTWDWIRGDADGKTDMGFPYQLPVAAPVARPGPTGSAGPTPMQLHYVDPPPPPVIIGRRAGGRASGRGRSGPDDAVRRCVMTRRRRDWGIARRSSPAAPSAGDCPYAGGRTVAAAIGRGGESAAMAARWRLTATAGTAVDGSHGRR